MFSVIALGACDEGAITEHRKVFSETLITYATGDDADHVTENITLRTSSEAVPEAILTWVSSDSSIIEIIDDIGEVTRPDITTTVVLTLKVSINDVVKQQKYSLTVIELEESNDDEDTTRTKTILHPLANRRLHPRRPSQTNHPNRSPTIHLRHRHSN